MAKAALMRVLAVALLGAACGEDGPTAAGTQTSVRFVNATTGVGSGGFTVNGQFAAGSALAAGQAAQTCSTIDPGTSIFGFGPAASGGSALSGNPIVTSNNEAIAAGGRYIVVAAGSATNPSLFVYGNTFSGDLSANQAAVRFVSLIAPASGAAAPNYVFYRGEIGATSPLALGLPYGVTSQYSVVPSGTSTFSAMQTPGNVTLVPGNTATLEAGSTNTIALVRNASGAFQLIHLPRCP